MAAHRTRMGKEPFGMWLYRASGMPWEPNDVNATLKTMTGPEFRAWFAAGQNGGSLPRWNGSVYFPAKVPDLIGIKERKYIDHTATHLNRGVGDIMRYAALVSWAESTEFGGHQVLGEGAEMPKARRWMRHCTRWRFTFNLCSHRLTQMRTMKRRAPAKSCFAAKGARAVRRLRCTRVTS